jgi:hypothetical protein
MTFITLICIIIFLIGLYFYVKYNNDDKDGFINLKRCPDLLIQKDAKFFLYNSKLAKVPGVNPIEFNNLEEYVEFLDWQKSQGIKCPVLYLQQTLDVQGNSVYKVRPGVSDLQGGLPPSSTLQPIKPPKNQPITKLVDATHDDPPYNVNSYPGFDQSSYYIGTTTPLDKMDITQQQQPISPNPMDPNWGGANYTQSLIDKGVYKEDEVSIYIP